MLSPLKKLLARWTSGTFPVDSDPGHIRASAADEAAGCGSPRPPARLEPVPGPRCSAVAENAAMRSIRAAAARDLPAWFPPPAA